MCFCYLLKDRPPAINHDEANNMAGIMVVTFRDFFFSLANLNTLFFIGSVLKMPTDVHTRISVFFKNKYTRDKSYKFS